MENIVVNGEQVNFYVEEMFKILSDIINEIHKLTKLKKELVWNSPNYAAFIEKYYKTIDKHLLFAQKLYEYVSFLNDYLSGYNNLNERFLKEFLKLKEEEELIYEQ